MKIIRGLNQGFTLVEVMVTTAILAFGIVVIYEALLISLNVFSSYSHHLNVQHWMNEKIWQTKDLLARQENIMADEMAGQMISENKPLDWLMAVNVLDAQQGLYQLDLTLSWQEAGRRVSILRSAYALPYSFDEDEN